MTRILLADDSPHAQRMGERILREEGFEVSYSYGRPDRDDASGRCGPRYRLCGCFLPRKSGYDIRRELKQRPRHKHVRVILTAGLLETFDDAQAVAVRCDGILKKPFEASVMMETLKPLLEGAQTDRGEYSSVLRAEHHGVVPVKVVTDPADLAPALSEVDVERVRAAVTIALDAALPAMIDKITEQVLVALGR